MNESCDRCGQPFPGDHSQEVDDSPFGGWWGGTPSYEGIVYWVCPFIEPEIAH